ncbi:hypothetical protein KIH39_03780 [Telmatocola sphagniphila]|uniref:Uncharacterized protein n=1 Tax=Telmatocola sphagniphila TaxID=1123043 RepID=A0A8E6B9J3_9BACT|nr:hypothetical protein [Telmatocola sphagniphila]QVL33048.1 hypothetical protein KIH39_03780 [Telmatocola sphagniphila]
MNFRKFMIAASIVSVPVLTVGTAFAQQPSSSEKSIQSSFVKTTSANAESNNAQGEWTTITGQILFPKNEKIPVMANITPNKDVQACLKDGPFSDETWVINPKNRGIRNAVVYLVPEGFKRGDKFPADSINPKVAKPAKPNAEIDQPCCSFIPHVLAMQEGQSLIIKNSASIPHNAKLAGGNIDINPLIPSGGQHDVGLIKADLFPLSLSCSIHGWMNAKIFVFDHPYFAVTDADGKFEIKDAPVGKFNLAIWHESQGWSWAGTPAKGRLGVKIDLTPGKTALDPIEFKLKPTEGK